MRGRLATTLLLLVGCAEERLRLDWPELGGAQAALLVLRRGDVLERGVFFDLNAGRPSFSEHVRSPEEVSLELGGYAESLGELGISPGEATPDLAGEPLPRALLAYRRSLLDGSWAPWPGDQAHAGLRFTRARACPGLVESRPLLLAPRPGRGTLLAPLAQGSLLLAQDGGRFNRVTQEGVQPIPELDALGLALPHSSAFLAPDGSLWLAGLDSHFGKVSPRDGYRYQEIASLGSADTDYLEALDGGATAQGLELFGATDSGFAFWYREDQRAPVFMAGLAPIRSRARRVVWVGPGEALVNGARGQVDHLRVESSSVGPVLRISGERLGGSGDLVVWGLARGPGETYFASTYEVLVNRVYQRGAEGWSEVRALEELSTVNDLLAVPGRGLLFAASDGTLGLSPEDRRCEEVQLRPSDDGTAHPRPLEGVVVSLVESRLGNDRGVGLAFVRVQ